MIDNVVYEKSVSECVKIGYLQQQKIQKISQSPRFAPHPIQKSWVRHCCTPVLKMKSRRLCIRVSCHFVCTVYCWVHFVTIAKMYGITCSAVIPVKSCLVLTKKSWFWSWSWHPKSWSWSWDPKSILALVLRLRVLV